MTTNTRSHRPPFQARNAAAGQRRRRAFVCLACCGALALVVWPSATATWAQQSPADLDARLLEELQLQLPETKDAAAATASEPQSKPAEKSQTDSAISKRPKELDSLDHDLLDELNGGEDAGQGPEHPLKQIAQLMVNVEKRIREHDTSRSTRKMQDQIVSDLDALIEECQKNQANKNCQNGQCNKPGQMAMVDAGKQPPTDSTTDLQNRQANQVETGSLDGMDKETWGNLPPKVRDAMVQAGADQFLPKYRQLIEDYFRSLSQEP